MMKNMQWRIGLITPRDRAKPSRGRDLEHTGRTDAQRVGIVGQTAEEVGRRRSGAKLRADDAPMVQREEGQRDEIDEAWCGVRIGHVGAPDSARQPLPPRQRRSGPRGLLRGPTS